MQSTTGSDAVAHLVAAQFAGGRRALDLPCRDGTGARLLIAAGATSVEACDADLDQRACARIAGQPGVRALRLSAESLAARLAPRSIDLVVCGDVTAIRHRGAFLRELAVVAADAPVIVVREPDDALVAELSAAHGPHRLVRAVHRSAVTVTPAEPTAGPARPPAPSSARLVPLAADETPHLVAVWNAPGPIDPMHVVRPWHAQERAALEAGLGQVMAELDELRARLEEARRRIDLRALQVAAVDEERRMLSAVLATTRLGPEHVLDLTSELRKGDQRELVRSLQWHIERVVSLDESLAWHIARVAALDESLAWHAARVERLDADALVRERRIRELERGALLRALDRVRTGVRGLDRRRPRRTAR